MSKILLCLVLLGIYEINGAKILIVFNALSRSHHILGDAFALGLAEKGHEVTMISPFESAEKHVRYKEILLDGEYKCLHNYKYKYTSKKQNGTLFEARNQSIASFINTVNNLGFQIANGTLYHPKVIDLLKSNASFDAVIAEVFLNECLLGLAQYYDAIPIMMSTGGAMIWTNKMVSNPFNAAYDANVFMPVSHPMSFLERLGNTAFSILNEFSYWYHIRNQNALYDKYFRHLYRGAPEEFPDLSTLVSKVSLVLLNSNIAISNSQALVPNMISVGGLHIRTDKRLPDDLQNILDEAEEGVIYFSLGSNLKSTELPEEKRNAILKTFSKLNQTVLWKWEDDKLPNRPKNVIIRTWMPQQSILNHKNVKLFITHGGLLSSIEALYFGIPLIGIPVFGDQHMNMVRATKSGYGINLDLNEITEETLTGTINRVLHNPSYRLRAQELSKIFRDEPRSPLEKAIYYVEYVLRHNGAEFLRSPATIMPLYQTLLLDVLLAIVVIMSLSIWFSAYLLKIVCSFCRISELMTNSAKKNN